MENSKTPPIPLMPEEDDATHRTGKQIHLRTIFAGLFFILAFVFFLALFSQSCGSSVKAVEHRDTVRIIAVVSSTVLQSYDNNIVTFMKRQYSGYSHLVSISLQETKVVQDGVYYTYKGVFTN